jgi:hypothetical protein
MRALLRYLLLFSCVFALVIEMHGQERFKGNYTNNDLKIKLSLNLYENDIPIPGLEMDSCYGFLQGNLNGIWIILKVNSIESDRAFVRAVSERGSDAQDIFMTIREDKVVVRQEDGQNIKGVKGRKYVKLPKEVVFEK